MHGHNLAHVPAVPGRNVRRCREQQLGVQDVHRTVPGWAVSEWRVFDDNNASMCSVRRRDLSGCERNSNRMQDVHSHLPRGVVHHGGMQCHQHTAVRGVHGRDVPEPRWVTDSVHIVCDIVWCRVSSGGTVHSPDNAHLQQL